MQSPSAQWHLDSRVLALLEDIRATRPSIAVTQEPSPSCLYGRVDVATFTGEAVEALEAIRSEYGKRCLTFADNAYSAAKERGEDANAAFKNASGPFDAWYSCPTVDRLVTHVLGEMQSLVSQESVVADAMAQIEAGRADAMKAAA